jgi:hypothetical protein
MAAFVTKPNPLRPTFFLSFFFQIELKSFRAPKLMATGKEVSFNWGHKRFSLDENVFSLTKDILIMSGREREKKVELEKMSASCCNLSFWGLFYSCNQCRIVVS